MTLRLREVKDPIGMERAVSPLYKLEDYLLGLIGDLNG